MCPGTQSGPPAPLCPRGVGHCQGCPATRLELGVYHTVSDVAANFQKAQRFCGESFRNHERESPVVKAGQVTPGLSLCLPVPREPGVESPLSKVRGMRLAVSKENPIEETPQPRWPPQTQKSRAVADRSGLWQAGQGRGRQVRAVAG